MRTTRASSSDGLMVNARQAAMEELIASRKEDKAALKPAMSVVEGWISERMTERDEVMILLEWGWSSGSFLFRSV